MLMLMILYYGSSTLFEKPTYGYGNPSNDYGLGFYMTDSKENAIAWAGKFQNGGYLLTFEIDISNLNVLRFDGDNELDVLRWITILIKHRFNTLRRERYSGIINWLLRHFDTDISNYDFIIGYRADDAYFKYSLDFVDGKLSLEKLSEAMRLGKLGLQYVLVSQKAFSSITFKGYEKVEHSSYYEDLRNEALRDYQRIKSEDNIYKNTFIMNLVQKYGE